MSDMAAIASNNAHISNEEIEQDIWDTEREIAQMEREAEHLASTPHSLNSARWDHMRAKARFAGIRERKKFVEKLKALLEYRRGLLSQPPEAK